MKNTILGEVVRHWKNNFTGITALALSDLCSLSHGDVMKLLEQLGAEKGINLQHIQAGHPIRFEKVTMNNNVSIDIPVEYDIVKTLMAFPSRDILEKVFHDEAIDYGIFTNRLHKGDSQIKHYYFKQEVLDKYLRQPDMYRINDDIIGGDIMVKDVYYLNLPEDKKDSETFGLVRYGKRKLRDETLAIAVIVWDLSEMPRQEQQYWASYEVQEPEFEAKDEEYGHYWRQSFKAEWVNYDDPLRMIYHIIRSINKTVGEKLFRNDLDNPYLRYPVLNNEKEYHKVHTELFKIIGPDSLDKDVLLELLEKRLSVPKNELLNSDQQPKGQWALFRVLMSKIPNASFEPFKICQNARTSDAHKVSKMNLPTGDLRKSFHGDCLHILEELRRLQYFLTTI